MVRIDLASERSEGTTPSRSAFVESDNNNRTPCPSQLGERGQVGRTRINRGWVEFEIARVDDQPLRCIESHTASFWDRMGHRYQPELEGALGDPSRIRDGTKVLLNPELFNPRASDRQRQIRSVHRHVDVAEKIAEGSDVIFVAVREDYATNIVSSLNQPAPVGEHEVDTQHIFLWKHETAVDQRDLTVELDRCAIPADLAKPAKKCEADSHSFWAKPTAATTASLVASLAGSNGRRGSPTYSQSALRPAFVGIGLGSRKQAP